MKLKVKQSFVVSVLVLVMVFVMSLSAVAADFPTKSITLVVPWSAGGITDRTARVFAPLWEKHLGQSVVIVNRPGASGAIGTDFAHSKPSDGYTVLLSAETPAVFKVMGTSDLGFEDFDALMMLVYSEKLIVVPADSPYQTLEDLISDIRERPGKVRLSYSGPGASGHIQGLLFSKNAGLDISMTPFGGGNPALLAVLGGQVDFTFSNLGTVLDYIKSGKLRPLAAFSNEKSMFLDGVPALTDALPELGNYLPLVFPNCLLVKKGTPPEVQKALLEAAEKAVMEPEWIDFSKNSMYVKLDELKGEAVLDYWKKWQSIVTWLLYDAGVTKKSPAEFNIPKL
ncbi:MAG TPA: tripartite tricarboxylate transporter substrate binding protein [Synergistales bacterium]|nr:tripartite tricarboxylate transporter substrate binding protein [Synergistales bacterium]